MHGGDDGAPVRRLDGAAAFLGHAEALAHDRLSGRRAEADDDLGLNELHLLLEPRVTGADLRVVRLLVDASRALLAALPFEVLHGVRHVDIVAVNPSLLERLIEQLSRRTDKRMAGAIFLIAWLLPDDHHSRPLWAFSEDRL